MCANGEMKYKMYMIEIKVKFAFSYTVTEDCFTRQGVKMNKSVANGIFLGVCCSILSGPHSDCNCVCNLWIS